MADIEAAKLKFVRALLADGGAARADGAGFAVMHAGRTVRLPAGEVRALVAAGVLAGDAASCRVTAEAGAWVRRALLGSDGFADQHRELVRGPQGETLNLSESPLARLARASAGESAPFLSRPQVEAGERVRRLAERAQLQPRLTMTYSPAHTAAGKGGRNAAAEISDTAAEARRGIAELARVLPRDCAGVVLDVCGLLKGLQTVETERGWPRRSAKLVLRIGLDQLARHYGYDALAVGPEGGKARGWIGAGARPDVWG